LKDKRALPYKKQEDAKMKKQRFNAEKTKTKAREQEYKKKTLDF